MVIASTTAMSTPIALLRPRATAAAAVGSFSAPASCCYAARVGQKGLFGLNNHRTASIGGHRWLSSSQVVTHGARREGGTQGIPSGSVRNRGSMPW